MSHLFGVSRVTDSASSERGAQVLRDRRRTSDHPGEIRVRTVRQMSVWRATLLALLAFGVADGTAFVLMSGVGALLHVSHPERQFDTYAVLHNEIVVPCFMALSVMWLLPPHPWATELIEVSVRSDPASRFPSPVTGKERAFFVSVYDGRAPPQLIAVA